MVDEQKFMNDLYKTIIEGSDLYHPDEPYNDLKSADPQIIYKCLDGKVDKVLDFTIENFITNDSEKLLIKDIKEIEKLIESPSFESACLSLAKYLDETRLEESYSDLLSKFENVVNLYNKNKQ